MSVQHGSIVTETLYRAVFNELPITRTQQGGLQPRMLRKLGVEDSVHDADVDVEPILPLELAQAACFFEGIARCALVSDMRGEVGPRRHKLVSLEYCVEYSESK